MSKNKECSKFKVGPDLQQEVAVHVKIAFFFFKLKN